MTANTWRFVFPLFSRMSQIQPVTVQLSKATLSGITLNSFTEARLKIFEKLKAASKSIQVSEKPIKCKIKDQEFDAIAFKDSPKNLLANLKSRELFLVARVNGVLWDLTRPLESDCEIEYLGFEDTEGQRVFWHSSAHILGEALECYFPCSLSSGPPTEQGFYYDIYMDGRNVVKTDLPAIEELCRAIMKQKQPFERLVVSRQDLLELFKDNSFKLRIINEKIKEEYTTVYRCGNLVDLCRGPHIEHTGIVGAFSIKSSSSTYLEGNSQLESLQRVHGVSFPTKKQLNEWKVFQEEAAKRDHRKLGKDNELFFFHELSPGSCFFLPKGTHIYNKLTEFIRSEYRKRGFTEVISPNMYNVKLWKTSGHYDNYAENMFMINIEEDQFALKPMNCPGHCLMFGVRPRSWKELPIRFADFGVLHRNEYSGALSGLTRVRRFCQDDAHIFCTIDQVSSEIHACLDFLQYVHKILGFTMKIQLSTRPEKSIGEDSLWERAESELKKSLDSFGHKWELNPGDGAFYGPKIDIQVKDALQRYHQISTIQLDFNLPQRFQLKYVNQNDTFDQPVMIHRAILGSLERVMGVMTEAYAGKWPFWLSPNQVLIIPLKETVNEYALNWQKNIFEAGYSVDVNSDPGESLEKKIRNAALANYNFILVMGPREASSNTTSVRRRGEVKQESKTLEALLEEFSQLRDNYVLI